MNGLTYFLSKPLNMAILNIVLYTLIFYSLFNAHMTTMVITVTSILIVLSNIVNYLKGIANGIVYTEMMQNIDKDNRQESGK